MTYATEGLKMPTNYVDMSSTEMEFDGGWSWKKFFVGVAIVGAFIALGGIGGVVGGLIAGSGAFVFGSGLAVAGGFGVALVGCFGMAACNETSDNSQSQ